ncbi:MAG: hypothetical protein R3E87_12155, partial [Burkholderiaceae bacterium]
MRLPDRSRLWQFTLLVILLGPPLGILVSWRDLDTIDFLGETDPNALSSWVTRIATGLALLSALLIVTSRMFPGWFRHMRRRQLSRRELLSTARAPASVWLLSGFVAFLLGNILLPGLFGAQPHLLPKYGYVLIVGLAAYWARDVDPNRVIVVARWGLLLMLGASLIVALVAPEVAVVTDNTRASFIGVRLWGLGSNPNSIAALGLVLLGLCVHTPFHSKLLTIAGAATGAAVVLTAQSQTVWIATAIVMPLMLFYRLLEASASNIRARPLTSMVLLLVLFG